MATGHRATAARASSCRRTRASCPSAWSRRPDAQPAGIGLEGLFYPTFYTTVDGDPATLMGDDNNPLISMLVYSGDLSMDSGPSQSVYVLDKSKADQVDEADGKPFRLDMRPARPCELPDGLGSVTFEGVEPWVRIQISKSPGQRIALGGVSLALLGLLGSLFIRPRRVLGAGPPGGWGHNGGRRRTGPVRRRRRDRRTCRARREAKLRRSDRDRRRLGTAERPGRRCGRHRLLPGPADPHRRVGLAADARRRRVGRGASRRRRRCRDGRSGRARP